VINNPVNPVLEAAYLYYYATDVGLQRGGNQEQAVKQQLMSLIGEALIIANEAKFDVFNALTLMDNVSFLKDLKVSSCFDFTQITEILLFLDSLGSEMAF